MVLNIEDDEAEALVAEIALQTGESEIETVRRSLRERRDRLRGRSERSRRDGAALRRWLETEVWSQLPPDQLDREPMPKADVERILGLGAEGS